MDRAAEQRTGAGTGGFAISLMGGKLSVWRPELEAARRAARKPLTVAEALKLEADWRSLTRKPVTITGELATVKCVADQIGSIKVDEVNESTVLAYASQRLTRADGEGGSSFRVRHELHLLNRSLRRANRIGGGGACVRSWWPKAELRALLNQHRSPHRSPA